MTASMALLSPVKLNLFLHITGQRDDGYHFLQTLFQLLDYGDDMQFYTDDSAQIKRVDRHDFALPDTDLSILSAQKLRDYVGKPTLGAAIILHKRVAPGSGLGTGSSNAATTLLALNKLWKLGLSIAELAKIGATISADVPVFIHGYTAWAEGVGDLISRFEHRQSWYCVLLPNVRVSTKAIFASTDAKHNQAPVSPQDFIDQRCVNTLEAVTVNAYPLVKDALDYLKQFGDARMSGTGAAVFIPTDSRHTAQQILTHAPSSCAGFVARSVSPGPVHTALNIG